jgi:hypothetical protein
LSIVFTSGIVKGSWWILESVEITPWLEGMAAESVGKPLLLLVLIVFLVAFYLHEMNIRINFPNQYEWAWECVRMVELSIACVHLSFPRQMSPLPPFQIHWEGREGSPPFPH